MSRSPESVSLGRGRRAAALALLLACAGHPALTANAALLPAGRGDFSLFAQSFSEPAADGQTRLLLVVEFPVAELAWTEQGDSLSARLACRWSLHALGREQAAVDEQLTFTRAAATPLVSMLYLRAVAIPPGEYRLELACRDEGRRADGVGGLFGRRAQASLSTTLLARDFRSGGLGDLLLYRALPGGERGTLNASALFAAGEPALELETCFSAPAVSEGAYVALTLKGHDAAGTLCLEKQGGWKVAAGEILPLRFRLPLAGFAPGDYRFRLDARGPGIDSTGVDCTLRIVAGGAASGDEFNRRAIEAQLFLTGDEYQRWLRLPAAEREAAMAAYWKRHDPDPATAENAVYDEFLARFRMAEARYGGFGPGALSDRGRMLIRFGEPASIEGEAMPLNRTGLSNAVRGLHGKTEVEPGISPFSGDPAEDEGLERGSDLARDLSAIGTGGAVNFGDDSEPYEVWTYEFGGAPLLAEHQLHLRKASLQLIFVDRSGYGDYTLVYRSEDFDF